MMLLLHCFGRIFNSPFTKNDWYNDNCKDKKRVFNHALNDFRENCSNENRYKLVNARSEYKSTLRTCKYEYDTQQSKRLEQLRHILAFLLEYVKTSLW